MCLRTVRVVLSAFLEGHSLEVIDVADSNGVGGGWSLYYVNEHDAGRYTLHRQTRQLLPPGHHRHMGSMWGMETRILRPGKDGSRWAPGSYAERLLCKGLPVRLLT